MVNFALTSRLYLATTPTHVDAALPAVPPQQCTLYCSCYSLSRRQSILFQDYSIPVLNRRFQFTHKQRNRIPYFLALGSGVNFASKDNRYS